MTESEAIKVIKSITYIQSDILNKAWEKAINALEKQIPKKPEMEKYTKKELYFCPICGTEVTDCTYCPHCGQKIDFGECRM